MLPSSIVRSCTIGALGLALLAPAALTTPAVAAQSTAAAAAPAQARGSLSIHAGPYDPSDRMIIAGTAAPGADVRVTAPDHADYSFSPVTARSDGTWSTAAHYIHPDQPESIVIEATTGSGTTAQTVRRTLVAAERLLVVDTTTYFPGQPVTVQGTTDPGQRVSIGAPDDRDLSFGSTNADVDGRWSITSRGVIDATDRSVRLEVTAGSKTIAQTLRPKTAAERTLTVDTDTYVPGELVEITGTGDPGSFISATFPGSAHDIDTTRVDDTGKWTATSTRPVSGPGAITISVTAGLGDNEKTIEHTLAPAAS